jgi:hypothetical protein
MNKVLAGFRYAALLIAVLIMIVPASAETAWENTEIPVENGSFTGGDISGNNIIFLKSEGMNLTLNRICLYTTDEKETKIIGTPSPGMTVTGYGISGNYAVWFEEDGSIFDTNESLTKPNTIYLADIENNTKKALNLSPTAKWPKISGDRIFGSEDDENSYYDIANIYDIRTEESTPIPEINSIDSAGVIFESGNIAYQNLKGDLCIYNPESKENITVLVTEHSNISDSVVQYFDMAGDYVIYIKSKIVFEGTDKGSYDEPWIYEISTGKSSLISPLTGEFTDSLTKDEKKATITSPFTDGKRVGFGLIKSESESAIILIDPVAGNSSVIRADGSVSGIKIDGSRMIWGRSIFPSFDQALVYAEEKEEKTESTAAPGFTVIAGITGVLMSILVLNRKKGL